MNHPPGPPGERLALHEPHEDGLDYVAMLWRRKWIVLPSVAAAAAVALGVYFCAAPAYQSQAVIVVHSNSPNVGVAGLDGSADNDADMQTQIFLIRSPRIVGRAVAQANLAALPSLAGQPDPVQTIINGLSAYHQEETFGLLKLYYTGPDRDDCRKILEAVVQAYRGFLRDSSQSVNQETVNLVAKAKDELLEQLNAAEARYREFKKNAPAAITAGSGAAGHNIHRLRLADIERQRSELLLKRTNLRGQIQAIEHARRVGGNEDVLAFVVGNLQTNAAAGQPQTIADRIFPLLLEEHRLLRKVGPDHPQVKDLRQQIEFTRSFLEGLAVDEGSQGPGRRADFVDIYVASLQQQIRINEDQEAELSKQFELEQQAACAYLDIEAQREILANDIHRKKALFDAIVQRLGEMSLMKDFGGYTLEVVTPAGAAWQIGPSLIRHLGIGSLIGLLLGFTGAYAREKTDKRFRAPEDICDTLGAPVVAHIPSLPTAETKAAESCPIDPSICTYHQPQSQFAEAFRAARVALYFSTQGESHQVIQVTSPSPGDGKSTLAANLAVSIAHSGKRVLLVEADLRRPRVHQLLGLHARVGLPAVLAGAAELEQAVYATAIDNLWCVPCGNPPQNPAELLTSRRFAAFVDVVRAQYDYVIIDTPPVLAVTDPCAIAAQVDGIYLTMRLKRNTRALAGRAAEMLKAVGGNVLGVVVNGAGRGDDYGYGYANYSIYGADCYGPSRYGYYGYGATVKEAQGYYQAAVEDGEEELALQQLTADAQRSSW